MKTLEEIKFDPTRRRQAGMTVPEGFFEQFQQRIEAEIDRQEKKPEPMIGQRKSVWSRWSVAASIVVLVAIGITAYKLIDVPLEIPAEQYAANTMEEELDNEEQDNMLIGSVSDFDLYDLYCDVY